MKTATSNEQVVFLEVEFGYRMFQFVDKFKTYDQALHMAEKMSDDGECGDFLIIMPFHDKHLIPNRTLELHECPGCRRKVRRHQMQMSADCHGIPYRLLCEKCLNRIYTTKGYDGEYYDETDENLDYDY